MFPATPLEEALRLNKPRVVATVLRGFRAAERALDLSGEIDELLFPVSSSILLTCGKNNNSSGNIFIDAAVLDDPGCFEACLKEWSSTLGQLGLLHAAAAWLLLRSANKISKSVQDRIRVLLREICGVSQDFGDLNASVDLHGLTDRLESKIVKYLKERDWRTTILHCAAQGTNAEVVQMLLKSKADPNRPDGANELPLSIASSLPIQEVLVSHIPQAGLMKHLSSYHRLDEKILKTAFSGLTAPKSAREAGILIFGEMEITDADTEGFSLRQLFMQQQTQKYESSIDFFLKERSDSLSCISLVRVLLTAFRKLSLLGHLNSKKLNTWAQVCLQTSTDAQACL